MPAVQALHNLAVGGLLVKCSLHVCKGAIMRYVEGVR